MHRNYRQQCYDDVTQSFYDCTSGEVELEVERTIDYSDGRDIIVMLIRLVRTSEAKQRLGNRCCTQPLTLHRFQLRWEGTRGSRPASRTS